MQARPALERLLREGARPPVLPLVRAGPLRPQLRARRSRLPGRLRALDGATQPPLLRQRRRQEGDRPRTAHRRDLPARGRTERLRAAQLGCACRGSASSSSTTQPGRRPSAESTPAAPLGRSPHRSRATPASRAHGPLRTPATGPCGSASSAPATTPRPCCFPTSSRSRGSSWPESPRAARCQPSTRSASSGSEMPAPMPTPFSRTRSIDAVFIVTRHSTHADLTCRALEAGKAVFVEKPLALTIDELERILATVDATGNDRVMVGFNRRFAPLLVEMRARFGRSSEPTNARYLVNAGRLASDSWYRDNELEGSRFVGEGGHFVDTMSWWIGSDPVEVMTTAAGGPDEVQVSLRYGDGSLATITYLTKHAPALSQGDLRGLERRADGPTRQLQADHRLVGRARARPSAPRARRTRVRRPRSRHSSSPCAPVGRCPSPWTRWRRPPAPPSPPQCRPWPTARRSSCDAPVPAPDGRRHRWIMNSVELEWRLRRLSKMSASEVRWRISDHVRRRRWASRQIMPEVSPRSWADRLLEPTLQHRGTRPGTPPFRAVSVGRGPAGRPGRCAPRA